MNDAFITELLPNITQYITFSEQRELQVRAQPMAAQIINQLDDFCSQAKRVATGMGANDSEQAEGAYKRYKQLPLQERIWQLVTPEDLEEIKSNYAKMVALPENAAEMTEGEVQSIMMSKTDPELFVKVLSRIVRVIKYNFLSDLQQRENSQPAIRSGEPEDDPITYLKWVGQPMVSRQLLTALTSLHAKKQPPLGFNALATVASDKLAGHFPDKRETGKQANIFLALASKKTGASLIRRESTMVTAADSQIMESSPTGLKRGDSLPVDNVKKVRAQDSYSSQTAAKQT